MIEDQTASDSASIVFPTNIYTYDNNDVSGVKIDNIFIKKGPFEILFSLI